MVDGSARRCLLFFIVHLKSNKTPECARTFSFRHPHLLHGPRDVSSLELNILPCSSRRSVAQETDLRKVSQIQTVFVVWHNVLAVGKQVKQSRVHLRLSSAPDIRAQTQRRLWPSRTSSQRDHRADTPGSSHLYAEREGKGAGRQLRIRRDASKAGRIATVADRRSPHSKPMSITSDESPLTTLTGSCAYLA